MQIKGKLTLLLTFLLILSIPFAFSETFVDYNTIVEDSDLILETYDIIDIPVMPSVEEFTATSSMAELDICVLAEEYDIIKVTNIGDTYSEYTVTLSGSAASFVTSVPGMFSLMPGKSTYVYNYIRFPKSEQGKYDLKVNIKTNIGLVKEFTQIINTDLCNNNVLLASNFNQTATPCVDMVYDFTIKNPSTYIETYIFGLDRFEEYADISVNPLILGPGEVGKVKLTLNLDCSIYGDYLLNFYSNAQGSDIDMKVPLLVNIEKAYDYDLITGNLFDNNEGKLDKPFVPKSKYTICGGHNKSIQIMIDNMAYVGNNFFYDLVGPEWGALYGNTASLNGHENLITYLDLVPGKDLTGEYKFVINANSQRGSVKVQEVVNVNVIDCYGLIVDVPKQKSLPNCKYSEIEFDVQNTGKFDSDISLEIEAPDYVTLDSMKINIPKESSEKSKLKIWPDCDVKGTSDIKVKAFLENGNAYAEDIIELKIVPIAKAYSLKINSDKNIRMTNAGEIIPVEIIHNGIEEAVYVIELVGLSWIETDAVNFTLAPSDVYSFNIIASPDNLSIGDYYADLNIKTDNVVYQKKLTFKIREGKSLSGEISDFLHYWRYWIYSGILILVILIVLIIYFKDKARIWRIKKLIRASIKKDEVKKKESKKKAEKTVKAKKSVKKKINLNWLYYLITIVVIAGAVYAVVRYNCCTTVIGYTLAFILDYIWYIVIGLLLLMVIISILNKLEK